MDVGFWLGDNRSLLCGRWNWLFERWILGGWLLDFGCVDIGFWLFGRWILIGWMLVWLFERWIDVRK